MIAWLTGWPSPSFESPRRHYHFFFFGRSGDKVHLKFEWQLKKQSFRINLSIQSASAGTDLPNGAMKQLAFAPIIARTQFIHTIAQINFEKNAYIRIECGIAIERPFQHFSPFKVGVDPCH